MLELMRRDTLKSALAGRTDKDLSVILAFLLKFVSFANYVVLYSL